MTVTIPTGRAAHLPARQPRQRLLRQPGDYGILTKGTGGTFILQETDGQIEAFNADGTLNYIQDTNGNRITAGYTRPADQPDIERRSSNESRGRVARRSVTTRPG